MFDRIIAQSAVRIDNDHNIGRLRLQVLDSTSESVAFSPFLGIFGMTVSAPIRRAISAVSSVQLCATTTMRQFLAGPDFNPFRVSAITCASL